MHPAAAIATTRPGASARRPAYIFYRSSYIFPFFPLLTNYDQLQLTTIILLPDSSAWIPLVLSSFLDPIWSIM